PRKWSRSSQRNPHDSRRSRPLPGSTSTMRCCASAPAEKESEASTISWSSSSTSFAPAHLAWVATIHDAFGESTIWKLPKSMWYDVDTWRITKPVMGVGSALLVAYDRSCRYARLPRLRLLVKRRDAQTLPRRPHRRHRYKARKTTGTTASKRPGIRLMNAA